MGIPGASFLQPPLHRDFGAFWKWRRKGVTALVLRHCGAPLPSLQWEGEGPFSPLGSHVCPHSPLHAQTCWVSPLDFCWSFLWDQYSSQTGLLYLGPWKNSRLFQFIICLSIAKRTWLRFHHTALQLHKLFITGAKIEAVLFGTFSFLFFPFKLLITACCEVVRVCSSFFLWWA